MKARKIGTMLLALIIIAVNCIPAAVRAETDSKNYRIIFTSDMHDHFLPNKVDIDDTVVESGGYSRLKTLIDAARKEQPNNILVDGGDYSMGSLFQTVFASNAPELRIMGQMGYEVVTLGNHEFDFRDNGLTRHLYAAKNSGEKLPQIVNSNISFPSREKMNKSLQDLQTAMKAIGVKEYTVIERNGFKVGIFGLIGKDAAESTPKTEVILEDIVKSAERTVDKLKNKEKVDLIVCLSHSGTDEIQSKSEDEQLAIKVPDIDVIVSGHTHTRLDKAIVIGDTIIGACGEYSNNLGVIDIERNALGRWKLKNYKLNPVTESIKENWATSETISKYKALVQEKYLNSFKMKFDQVLANSNFSFIPTDRIGSEHKEEPLGNLIADSYIYSVKKAEGDNYIPVDIAIVAAGTMRGSFTKGQITVNDAFVVSSLGIGTDGVAGYPLISVFITGRELMDLCEVDASISPMMNTVQLYMSGVSFTFNPNRMLFNKVTEAHIVKPDGSIEKLQENKLYRLVTGLYNAQMLSIVGDKSFGLLSIVPKTKEGKQITDFEKQIIYDTGNTAKNEVKEWLSIAQYLGSFEKVNGVPQIPDYYKQPHGRKIVIEDGSIGAILSNPNSVALKIYAIGAGLLIVLILLMVLVLKLIKRFRRKAVLGN